MSTNGQKLLESIDETAKACDRLDASLRKPTRKQAIVCLAGFVIGVSPLLVLMPLLGIWAINTLFSLQIDFTFWNWLAGFVLWCMLCPKPAIRERRR